MGKGMILDDLKNFIIANPECSRAELAKAFMLSEDGVEAMLRVWVKKGKLKIKQNDNYSSQTRYRWLVNEELPIRLIK